MADGRPQRKGWHRVGVWLTAAWILLVLVVSGGRRSHPLMDYIFVVPLAAWVVAVIAERLILRARRKRAE